MYSDIGKKHYVLCDVCKPNDTGYAMLGYKFGYAKDNSDQNQKIKYSCL